MENLEDPNGAEYFDGQMTLRGGRGGRGGGRRAGVSYRNRNGGRPEPEDHGHSHQQASVRIDTRRHHGNHPRGNGCQGGFRANGSLSSNVNRDHQASDADSERSPSSAGSSLGFLPLSLNFQSNHNPLPSESQRSQIPASNSQASARDVHVFTTRPGTYPESNIPLFLNYQNHLTTAALPQPTDYPDATISRPIHAHAFDLYSPQQALTRNSSSGLYTPFGIIFQNLYAENGPGFTLPDLVFHNISQPPLSAPQFRHNNNLEMLLARRNGAMNGRHSSSNSAAAAHEVSNAASINTSGLATSGLSGVSFARNNPDIPMIMSDSRPPSRNTVSDPGCPPYCLRSAPGIEPIVRPYTIPPSQPLPQVEMLQNGDNASNISSSSNSQIRSSIHIILKKPLLPAELTLTIEDRPITILFYKNNGIIGQETRGLFLSEVLDVIDSNSPKSPHEITHMHSLVDENSFPLFTSPLLIWDILVEWGEGNLGEGNFSDMGAIRHIEQDIHVLTRRYILLETGLAIWSFMRRAEAMKRPELVIPANELLIVGLYQVARYHFIPRLERVRNEG
ncbi:hypothetical protein M422DRAFT_40748 [Sphaerobolus stellatus SS14]|nr:hypothetical protein M422DRAFT_40748 [Sphaerobolus stellatus SS14]